MKRILGILLAVLPLFAVAQLVQPVKWTGEEIGDSVRLKAVIDPGFHMSIIEFGDFEYDDEYVDSFVVTLAKTDLTPIRFNACDDKMCTAPEVWEYSSLSAESASPLSEASSLSSVNVSLTKSSQTRSSSLSLKQILLQFASMRATTRCAPPRKCGLTAKRSYSKAVLQRV